jgi:hypothetical protein
LQIAGCRFEAGRKSAVQKSEIQSPTLIPRVWLFELRPIPSPANSHWPIPQPSDRGSDHAAAQHGLYVRCQNKAQPRLQDGSMAELSKDGCGRGPIVVRWQAMVFRTRIRPKISGMAIAPRLCRPQPIDRRSAKSSPARWGVCSVETGSPGNREGDRTRGRLRT